ncbi:glycosyl transferase 2 family protein [Burkholderia humptydooensis]|uniref:Glycosyl transferase, group 2 family protein n=1 Tax=Burkholderia humptydooensis MSMB43 TaxID=441157 RepID=A0ABN0G263_9BURK|nr:glycosyl transferase 2 family protein [Burkholderia sp. 2002721687]ALX46793.1 glycosyl transferase family 2 [Burkholderia humptydooensis]EIP86250.1 glycosyl transferase, group 2 family protein [Burkholderia humptydooensis MSMB43]
MRDHVCVTPARVVVPTREPRITAIVLTHRREHELARTLARLARLPERPAIIVVDNASNDGTAAMVRRRFPCATLVRAPRNLGAAGAHAVHRVLQRRHMVGVRLAHARRAALRPPSAHRRADRARARRRRAPRRSGLRGWRRTLAGLPWTLRERRPIPMRVDAMRRVVEATERIARRQARRQQR